jgi:hypothetical protein
MKTKSKITMNTSRRASGLMALTLAALTMSGCVSGPSESAICSGTKDLLTSHAGGLATDGGPVSQRTGRALIALYRSEQGGRLLLP